MNTLAFTFQKHPVRTIEKSGEIWFAAPDLCHILNLKNPRSSLALLDKSEKGVHTVDAASGIQKITIVSESGMYSLVLRSRRPAAKQFKRWVTSEVLPSIRRTGTYQMKPISPAHRHDALRVSHLEDALLRCRPDYRAILRYLDMGLNQTEIGRLLLCSADTVRRRLIEMSACGLAFYAPNPQRIEYARLGGIARWQKHHAAQDEAQPQLALEG